MHESGSHELPDLRTVESAAKGGGAVRRTSLPWKSDTARMGYLETALFVRDAARLPVAAGLTSRPCYRGPCPLLRLLAPERPRDCRAAVGGLVCTGSSGKRLPKASGPRFPRPVAADPAQEHAAAVRRRFAGRDGVFDPPETRSLARLRPLHRSSPRPGLRPAWSRGPAARQAQDARVLARPVVRDVAGAPRPTSVSRIGDITGDAYVLPLRASGRTWPGRVRALLGRAGP